MSEQAPAYAQAVDQLRAERDAALARAEAAEKDRDAIAQTPDGGWHLAHQQAAARAEAAEKERDSLRAQLDAVTAERDAAIAARDDANANMRNWKRGHDSLSAQLAEVTAERDSSLLFMGFVGWVYKRPRDDDETIGQWVDRLTAAIHANTAEQEAQHATINRLTNELADAGDRFLAFLAERADAQAQSAEAQETALEMQTGPVAFERNQLRDELAELRPQVDDLRAKLAAADHRAVVCEHEADEAHRAVTVLSTIIRASVEAIARGVK